ncbi:uncharacterized protein SPPG_05855 [Spizellomyces punctatus DAOM BR117]|uniref:Uncharacterized protein n=1 Tax=Spizellomyces punctatus (strain DAOM BR117) TaxID=645134 RepID=A0A0L0HDP0_SPIPD|nr:uncharacterized protein SPPG_05855 [Spizellomyces punctatus DAOM BR117]KNC98888.1 hypothetical protein SPPG_05855 [Spizellomyces punctatus DAOM BR117]|eukprot:XP_016606928.1 hypothetical protein SPPG_05855 [Spizellomyces punctatus DAOM BR117]
MDFLKKASALVGGDENPQTEEGQDRGLPFKLPGFVVNAIDQYLDGLKPELSPLISREIGNFQESTLSSLEIRVKEIVHQICHGDFSALNGSGGSAGTNVPTSGGYGAPSSDGNGAALMQATGGYGYGAPQAAVSNGSYMSEMSRSIDTPVATTDRGIIQDALNAAQSFATTASSTIFNPEEKARELIPPLREQVSRLLADKHQDLADRFSEEAIKQIKIYLHGNISPREIGSGAVDDAVDLVSGFFGGNKQQETDRAIPGMSNLKALFSRKLSEGMVIIRGQVSTTMHRELTTIEANIFTDLPSHIRGPLEFVFGGNPFQNQDRGLVSDVADKFKSVVRGLQEGIQERARGVVIEGHRELEGKAVDRVQDVVVERVRKYVPDIQI